jgi:DNA polymerase-3 subunit alpha
VSLFGEAAESSPISRYPQLPEWDPFSRADHLAAEKEVLGIYLSDHPLRGYERIIANESSHPCSAVADLDEGESVRLAGVIANVRTIITKSKGEKMATITLEDFSGQATVVLFAKTYQRFADVVAKDLAVKISGTVMHRERPGNGGDKVIEVRLETLTPLEATLDLPPTSCASS